MWSLSLGRETRGSFKKNSSSRVWGPSAAAVAARTSPPVGSPCSSALMTWAVPCTRWCRNHFPCHPRGHLHYQSASLRLLPSSEGRWSRGCRCRCPAPPSNAVYHWILSRILNFDQSDHRTAKSQRWPPLPEKKRARPTFPARRQATSFGSRDLVEPKLALQEIPPFQQKRLIIEGTLLHRRTSAASLPSSHAVTAARKPPKNSPVSHFFSVLLFPTISRSMYL